MLAYARHHQLARPPESRPEVLLCGLELGNVDERLLSLPFPPQEVAMRGPIGEEQLCISKEAAIMIHEVIACKSTIEIVDLRRRPRVLLDYPLERRRQESDRKYSVPADLSSVIAGVPKMDTGDSFTIETELSSLFDGPDGNWVLEHYEIDQSATILLQELLQPHGGQEYDNIKVLTKSPSKELHLELPLLPAMRSESRIQVYMAPDLSQNISFMVADLTKEDADATTREDFDDDFALIDQMMGDFGSELPVVNIKPKLLLEIEMPMTPRAPPPRHMASILQPQGFCTDPSLKFDSDLAMKMTSSPTNLHSVFGEEFDYAYDPWLQEQLEIFDTALRIPEPHVGPVMSRPNLSAFPSGPLDLVRSGSKSSGKYAVDFLPARHLDIAVRWAPVVGKIDPVDVEESLPGSDIVMDFIHEDIFTTPNEPFVNLAERPVSPDHPSSMLSPKPFTGEHDKDQAWTQNCTSWPVDVELKSVTLDGDVRSDEIPPSQYPSSESGNADQKGDVENSDGVANEYPTPRVNDIALYDSTTGLLSPFTNAACSASQADDGRHQFELAGFIESDIASTMPSMATMTMGHRTCLSAEISTSSSARTTDFVNRGVVDNSVNRPSPGATTRQLNSPKIATEDLFSDDSLHQILETRKRQLTEDEGSVSQYENELGGIQDFMRLRMNQGPGPKVRRLTETGCQGPRQHSQENMADASKAASIAPSADPTQFPQQEHYYTISTTLLDRPALWRPLKRQNAKLSLIERDLDPMHEVDLICSVSSGIMFFSVEHIQDCSLSRDLQIPSQLRMINCVRKYQNLSIVITLLEQLTEDQYISLAKFQGWLSSACSNTNIRLVVPTTDEEQARYLCFFAAHYTKTDGAIQGPLPIIETRHELFLRSCPFLNALQAQSILARFSLSRFLMLEIKDMSTLLHKVGVVDQSQITTVYEFFKGDWHGMQRDNMHEYDFVDGNMIA